MSRRHLGAGLIAVGATVVTAVLAWFDRINRQTEGFEWQFNNAVQGSCCGGTNYVLLTIATGMALVAARDATPSHPTASGSGDQPSRPA